MRKGQLASSSSEASLPLTGNGNGRTQQSPRALATREKNREAVRKCRQRKRERTEELKQRCEELAKENVRLRMRLELGSEEAVLQKMAKGKQLVQEMQRLLSSMEGKLADKEKTQQKDALELVYHQFFERHMELGPDKLASLSFVVKRLHGLLEPDALTKAYLFILSLDDRYFDELLTENPASDPQMNWWSELCRELDLTEEQKRQLKLRRLTAQRTKAEMFYVAQRAQSMSRAIIDRRYLVQSFMEMMKVFTSAQLAKFVVWISTDPCGNELLDMLWTELIQNIDIELDGERAQLESADVRAHEVQQLLNAVRQENGSLFRTLFDCNDIRDSIRNARRIFSDDVVLIDPSNGGEYRGLDQVMRYVDKMRRAFTPSRTETKDSPSPASPHSNTATDGQSTTIRFVERSIDFSGDKAIAKFHISGLYNGRLLDPNSSGNPMVDCDCVVDITFAESSAKIKELVITTDLLGLFQILGQAAENASYAKLDNSTVASPQRKPSIGSLGGKSPHTVESVSSDPRRKSMDVEAESAVQASDLDLRKREHILAELRGLFELEDEEEVYRLAGRILAERCVFVDANMGTDHRGVDECFSYIKRIRSAFPRMNVVEEVYEKGVKSPGERIKIEWLLDAEYGGKLASQAPKPCTLRGTLFLTMDSEEGEVVSHLAMSWNASELLKELGVQLKDQRLGPKRQSSTVS